MFCIPDCRRYSSRPFSRGPRTLDQPEQHNFVMRHFDMILVFIAQCNKVRMRTWRRSKITVPSVVLWDIVRRQGQPRLQVVTSYLCAFCVLASRSARALHSPLSHVARECAACAALRSNFACDFVQAHVCVWQIFDEIVKKLCA